jgi:hypothetical protein
MLGGLADIRGNVRNTGASTFFSTGPVVPRTRITGRMFDWVAGSVTAGAVVESFIPPDSSYAYVAISDSSGRFSLEHVPAGRYLVRGFVDRNKNRGIDPGEPWDSVTVTLADSAVVELLVFAHDTVAPRIRDVGAVDSLGLRVAFDRPVDPSQQLTAANFAVVGPDSIPVPIVSVSLSASDTIPTPAVTGARPSPEPMRAPVTSQRDTADRQPAMSRPRPITEIVIQLARRLTPGATYRVRSIALRGLLGATGNSERGYVVPAAPAATRPDTTARAVPSPTTAPVR